MGFGSAILEILNRPTIGDVMFGLMMFMSPFWVAVVVGWTWKPKWANQLNVFLEREMIKEDSKKSIVVLSQFTASVTHLRLQVPSCISRVSDFRADKDSSSLSSVSSADCCFWERESLVNVHGLKQLHRLVEERDGGPAWIKMMEKSTANMRHQAWRRDPKNGPLQYRNRTVYEDATPEMLRDFLWDNEFRFKWDDKLIHAETLEECLPTKTMDVQWVRKYLFFCSDREHIIGRRIWKWGRAFSCVTTSLPCSSSSVPRRYKRRRVNSCHSSWCIRAAESKRGGQLTACEVLLFHQEGTAQVTTKVDVGSVDTAASAGATDAANAKPIGDKLSGSIPKLLVIGGAIALACTLNQGILANGFVFGVARKFARTVRRL